MISLAKVLTGEPLPLIGKLKFYQPTLKEIVDLGENNYWAITNLWLLKRKDMVEQETEESRELDDYSIWRVFVAATPTTRQALELSCRVFLKTKVEFFDISNTIYIGEKESGVILDETFYLLMREICSRITPALSASEEGGQYHETDNMSERERQMIAKMKSSAKKIEETKNPNKKPEDFLGNRILGLVAVGGYTFEQVYNMTMLQFNMLLQKYVDIQTFELRTVLSPYISSEDDQNKTNFWLD